MPEKDAQPRRIRLGLVGGAGGALIGPVHRIAARLDDRFALVAGVLSSRPERSVAEAEALGLRGYPDVPAMLAGEAACPDGIEAVAIATPNSSHAHLAGLALDAGLDVICDKPLTNDLQSAVALAEKARAKGLVLSLTHNYSGYPMVREARAAIAANEIGPVRVVHVAYVQGSLGSRVEDAPDAMPARLRWRLDPEVGGISHVLADIGTHAHQLLTYVTGQRVAAVLADVGAALPGRTAHDTASVIVADAGWGEGRDLRHQGRDGRGERADAGSLWRGGRRILAAIRAERAAGDAQQSPGGAAHKRPANAAPPGQARHPPATGPP